MYEIRHYLTADERDVYLDWLRKQRDITAKIAVDRRVNRVEQGILAIINFVVMECGSYALMWVRAIVCIMLSRVKKLCYCCVVATSERKMRTSTVVANIGKIGKEGQKMKDRMHDDAMAEMYREDPAYALQLLNSILEDGDQSELLIALRQMAKAFGGMQAIAEQAHLNTTQLYRTLSPEGNPALSSFSAILKAMGMRISVQPIQHIQRHMVEPPNQISN